MKIDKELFQKALDTAVERGLSENDEDSISRTLILYENDDLKRIILRAGLETSNGNFHAAAGTLFEMGFEAGLVYNELDLQRALSGDKPEEVKEATKEAGA